MSESRAIEVSIQIKKNSLTKDMLEKIIDYPLKLGFAIDFDFLLSRLKITRDEYRRLLVENLLQKKIDHTKPSAMHYAPPLYFYISKQADYDELCFSIDFVYFSHLDDKTGNPVFAGGSTDVCQKLTDLGIYVWNLLSSKVISGRGVDTWEYINPNDKDVWPIFPWEKYVERKTFWLNFVCDGELFPKKYRYGNFTDSPEFEWYKVISLKNGKLYLSSPLPYSITAGLNKL